MRPMNQSCRTTMAEEISTQQKQFLRYNDIEARLARLKNTADSPLMALGFDQTGDYVFMVIGNRLKSNMNIFPWIEIKQFLVEKQIGFKVIFFTD